ncbi:MAG: putative lipoprotein [Bacteriophage sp.]|nr:MAG: putative lipoprotein [Bacteriophage sp.]
MKQSNLPTPGLLNTLLLLVALPLLLTACASNSPACLPVSQPLPAPPLMSTPQPQESYSARAQRNISEWQSQLMATQLMRK